MTLKYWFDTPEDSDRKRRRQAEFLGHQFFPWQLITEIGVMHHSVKAEVEKRLQTQSINQESSCGGIGTIEGTER